MRNILILLIITFCAVMRIQAQNDEKVFYNDYITIEPAIGTRFMTFTGSPDLQIAMAVQYNLYPKLNFLSHTSLSFDIKPSMFSSVNTKHSYTLFQRFGVGTTLYFRKISNFFL